MDKVKNKIGDMKEGLNPSSSQRDNMESDKLSSPDDTLPSEGGHKQTYGNEANPNASNISRSTNEHQLNQVGGEQAFTSEDTSPNKGGTFSKQEQDIRQSDG